MGERTLRWASGAGDGALLLLGVLMGLAAPAVGLGLGTLLRQLDSPGEAPASARWAACATSGGGLATATMPVPDGVLVRVVGPGGSDVALVSIEGRREVERFLAELGCRPPEMP
jgi:hypothetical protein